MDLFFWKSPEGNFGDDLNDWIWDQLLPGWRGWAPGVTLFGVGTLLNDKSLSGFRERPILVAGTGVGYGRPVTGGLDPAWDIRALRGPLSARALGLPETVGLVDPAVMIPEFPEFQDLPRSGRPVFVPHIASRSRHDWATACAALGVDYVSPSQDARQVIRALAGASLVLAESMHAAILADAFRVPWVGVSISGSFNAGKWQDWAQSLGVEPGIQPLFPGIARLGAALRRPAPQSLFQAGRPAPPATGTPGVRRVSPQQRVRVLMERAVLSRALARALARPPVLSDAARLAERRAAYRAVLQGIRRDYAPGA